MLLLASSEVVENWCTSGGVYVPCIYSRGGWELPKATPEGLCCCVCVTCHWRELPKVSFLSRETRVCRDKTRLSRQNTSFGREKSMLLATKCLSRQTRVYLSFWNDKQFCRDKRFVATNIRVCRDKRRDLSRQTRVCRDKNDTWCSSRQ